MAENLLLEDLDFYQLAVGVGEFAWDLVDKRPLFPKKTIGAQFVKATDSIAANIAEGTSLLL